MTIETAKEWRRHAEYYRSFGFNLVPLGSDKRPVITGINQYGAPSRFRWDDWQQLKQTDKLWKGIREPAFWADVAGLGGICGPVSDNLVCIDFDATPEADVEAFLQHAELPANYAWTVSTPGSGFHVWILCPGLQLEKGKLNRPSLSGNGHIELRYTGHYAALPPSMHPSGGIYAWAYAEPSSLPAGVMPSTLLAAYDTITAQEAATTAKVALNGANGYSTTVNGASLNGGVLVGTAAASVIAPAYAETALAEEAQRMRTAAPRTRNDTANRCGFSLGQLVGAGLLGEYTAEQTLVAAAMEVGLSESEASAAVRSGMRAGMAKPRQVQVQVNGASSESSSYEYGFTVDCPDPTDFDQLLAMLDVEAPQKKHQTWPYAVHDNRICLLREDKDGEIVHCPIASFTAQITGQILDEDGSKTFVISGEAVRGGPYTLEQPAEKFGKDSELRAALERAVGPYDPVYNRMSEHLVPAIKILTTEANLETIRRFRRTGWIADRFLIPGMQAEDTRIELPDKLPYRVSADAELDIALPAWRNLIESVDPAISTPIITMMLQAPLHRPAGWQNERYGVFIQGRTGSLKTSFTQTAMAIYGAEFAHDRTLIKLGEGATRNAIMAYATNAHDMPLFIDNYKPNTGFGFNDLVNLIHNILEGGEKDRLTRASVIKEARPVHCFPVITGEDVPDHDPATIARLLLIAFEWQAGQPNERLAYAQANSEELSAIGLTWLTWLSSEDGRRIVKQTAAFLPQVRNSWAEYLRSIRRDMVNILRVATNLATNELTWSIALQHPTLGEFLAPYTAAHGNGLRRIADNMAKATTEALEANRFLAGLRELLATGQGVLIQRDRLKEDVALHERDRMIGWVDEEGVYLLPTAAMERVRKLLGPQAVTVSLQVLYGQFDGLKLLGSKGRDKITRPMRMQGETQRVLHLIPDVLVTQQEVTDAALETVTAEQMAAIEAFGL